MIDWDDAFDNSGYVPGVEAIREGWVADAAAFRAGNEARLDLPYGDGSREVLDLFVPQGAPEGGVVFVHGGYWHMLDKSCWSHLAAGCLAHGRAFAVPSYPLAPDARIAAITRSVAAAIERVADEVAGPIRLIGHSAGGHLVARMACEGVLPGAVADRIRRVVPISGVHDLAPLIHTRMNDTLRLDEAEAAAESPACLAPRPGLPVTFWVGAGERPEFLRQTRLAAERWAAHGAPVADIYEAGRHHFDVIDSLARPDGALTREVLR